MKPGQIATLEEIEDYTVLTGRTVKYVGTWMGTCLGGDHSEPTPGLVGKVVVVEVSE